MRLGLITALEPISRGLIAYLVISVLVQPGASCEAGEGYATYYSTASCIREGTSVVLTASGRPYNEHLMTCAMRRRDWGTRFLVCGVETGKCQEVELTDFGPGKKATARGVIVDLTPAAFAVVCGDLKQGKCETGVQEIL